MSWTDELPRKYYEKYERVNVKSEWFEVFKLPCNIYAITEPKHFQEVNSFLIIGSERALLLDTGMGIENIKSVVEELYTGEVEVVNSHFHFDHITDDKRFDRVYSCNEPYALSMLRRGFTTEELAFQIKDDQFADTPPAWLDRAHYTIPPINPIPVDEGHVFSLGERDIRVIRTPGHSADGIMLYDEGNRLLFTGDTFYLGALYVHFDSPFLGKSDFRQYLDSLTHIQKYLPKLDYIICSHNDMLASPDYLRKAYEAFLSIANGTAVADGEEDIGLHGHGQKDASPVRFVFDGFSVIVKQSDVGK